jgi:xylose dehydrogenase (NAD/NADP)
MAVTWGILSTARINRRVVPAAHRSELVSLEAVASRNRERAEAYARTNGITRAYGSYEELLRAPDVEAVYISLPNSMHIEWSLRALEAGKHVLCEKPLSRSAQEVEQAFSLAERLGLCLSEAFMYRHNPQTLALGKLIDEGVVGRPLLVRAAFSFTASEPTNIRLAADLDGGSLMDVGCYCVNGARYLLGEPHRVFGEQVVSPGDVDVVFSGTMRFAGDRLAAFDSGLALPVRDELEVIGETGSLFLDDPWHCRQPGIELRRNGEREQISVAPADSYQLQLENFSEAIRGQGELLLGRQDAVGQARVIEALYRSANEGAPIALQDAE